MKKELKGVESRARRVDRRGSSTSHTKTYAKASREAIEDMRADWRFYVLMTFCSTFGDELGVPRRTCEQYEGALCEPTANDWIIEVLLRLMSCDDGDGRVNSRTSNRGRELLVVEEDWEERLDEAAGEMRRELPREFPDGPPIDMTIGKTFYDVDPLTRMDVLYALCERTCARSRFANETASAHANEYDKAQKKRVSDESSYHSELHGAPIGYDVKGCAYYVVPGSCRLFRAAKVSFCDLEGPDDPTWCTPCVTFDEVATFTRALSTSTSKKEKLLYEYLKTQHLPVCRAQIEAEAADVQRAKAKRSAEIAAAEKRAFWEAQERRSSSRLVNKVNEKKKVSQRGLVPPKPSEEECENVRAAIRSWILQPSRLRTADDQPPFGVKIEQLRVPLGPSRSPAKKPKGREWKNLCVCVQWDEGDGEAPTWHDAVVWDYDSVSDKARVFYTETQTMEEVNLEWTGVRVGGPAPPNLIDKHGLLVPFETMMIRIASSMKIARAATTWTGSWIEAIVGGGIPGHAQGSRLLLKQTAPLPDDSMEPPDDDDDDDDIDIDDDNDADEHTDDDVVEIVAPLPSTSAEIAHGFLPDSRTFPRVDVFHAAIGDQDDREYAPPTKKQRVVDVSTL